MNRTSKRKRAGAGQRTRALARSSLMSMLAALHLDDPARRAWRRVLGGGRSRMRFPPYAEDIQHLVAISPDPVRYGLVALALGSIAREGVKGSLAEVGVYRGELSRLIHRLMPERSLYLFDTFEGFPPEDLERVGDKRFRDTSVEMVKSRIGDMQNVMVRQGYFPDTAAGLEGERFAFVVLDLDLHKPTLAALEFFYGRMTPGGFIIVDDYNNSESGWAVSRAFDEFMADKPERAIQIPDAWGSLILRKL